MKKGKRAKATKKRKQNKKTKQKPKERFIPKYTIFLIVLTTLIYFIFSSALLYIPTRVLMVLGFAFFNLKGIITYQIVHISPVHLLGNMFLLLPMGVIAEKKLRAFDFFAIYLLAGSVSAIVFSALIPDTILVGASAAISGLIAAAFMVDFKKALVLIIAFSFLTTLVAPTITSYTKEHLEELRLRNLGLSQKLSETDQQIQIAISMNDSALALNLSKQRNETAQQYAKSIEEEVNLDIGLDREKETKTSVIVHLVGALCGMAYLAVRRRDIIWEMPYQLIPRKYLQKSSKK